MFDDPLEEMVQLKQTGDLCDYQESFEKLACQCDLTKTHKLSYYLGGLKHELALDVKLFHPNTLLEATKLAKIHELSMKCKESNKQK